MARASLHNFAEIAAKDLRFYNRMAENAGVATFIAQAASGALVWVYRSRLPVAADEPGWFLQGLFA